MNVPWAIRESPLQCASEALNNPSTTFGGPPPFTQTRALESEYINQQKTVDKLRNILYNKNTKGQDLKRLCHKFDIIKKIMPSL